ncbi:MAG: hypothetical protein LDLANPLL_00675 [Turneriella sp.]|nr:hypothetical protein [Turneriella sp.]
MISPAEIEAIIKEKLPDAQVEVLNPLGDGLHFEATVVSAQFVGLPLIKQHKLVMGALEKALQGKLHALQLKTKKPE